MKSINVFLLIVTCLFCKIGQSQTVRGNGSFKTYFGFHDYDFIPNFLSIGLYVPMGPPESINLSLNHNVYYGPLTVEYYPEIDNIWQVAYGNKVDLSNSQSQAFNHWSELNTNAKFIFTDSINPYPQNIEHSIKIKFDTLLVGVEYPSLHGLNVSLAQGDSLFIEFGNDNLINDDYNLLKYVFCKSPEGYENLLGYYGNTVGSYDLTWSHYLHESWNESIFKVDIYSYMYPVYWVFQGQYNYLKLTLKSGSNNINNAGASLGGFFWYDPTTVSIKESQNTKNEIKLFPNPFKDEIIFNTSISPDFIEVFDINGRIVWSKENNESINKINLSFLKEGTYILRIHKDSKVNHQKIIKM